MQVCFLGAFYNRVNPLWKLQTNRTETRCTVLWIAEDVEHLCLKRVAPTSTHACTPQGRDSVSDSESDSSSRTHRKKERSRSRSFHKHRPLDHALGVKLPTRHDGSGWQIKPVLGRQTPGGHDDEQEKMHFRKEEELMARLWYWATGVQVGFGENS